MITAYFYCHCLLRKHMFAIIKIYVDVSIDCESIHYRILINCKY